MQIPPFKIVYHGGWVRRGGSGGLAPRSAWGGGCWKSCILHCCEGLRSITPKWAACEGAEIVGPLFATGRCPISMNIHGHAGKCMEMYGYQWISMVLHGHPWISMDILSSNIKLELIFLMIGPWVLSDAVPHGTLTGPLRDAYGTGRDVVVSPYGCPRFWFYAPK